MPKLRSARPSAKPQTPASSEQTSVDHVAVLSSASENVHSISNCVAELYGSMEVEANEEHLMD